MAIMPFSPAPYEYEGRRPQADLGTGMARVFRAMDVAEDQRQQRKQAELDRMAQARDASDYARIVQQFDGNAEAIRGVALQAQQQGRGGLAEMLYGEASKVYDLDVAEEERMEKIRQFNEQQQVREMTAETQRAAQQETALQGAWTRARPDPMQRVNIDTPAGQRIAFADPRRPGDPFVITEHAPGYPPQQGIPQPPIPTLSQVRMYAQMGPEAFATAFPGGREFNLATGLLRESRDPRDQEILQGLFPQPEDPQRFVRMGTDLIDRSIDRIPDQQGIVPLLPTEQDDYRAIIDGLQPDSELRRELITRFGPPAGEEPEAERPPGQWVNPLE